MRNTAQPRADREPRIGVLGLGSVLMGDDGLGPYMVELLASRWRFPENVLLLDVGTPGPDLADYLMGLDAVLLLDTIRAPGRPGAIQCFRGRAVADLPTTPRMSPHDPNLGQALLTARLAGREPREVVLVGMIAETVELGTRLSDPVQSSLPELEAVVLSELHRLGIDPEPREAPCAPRVWWQNDGAIGNAESGV